MSRLRRAGAVVSALAVLSVAACGSTPGAQSTAPTIDTVTGSASAQAVTVTATITLTERPTSTTEAATSETSETAAPATTTSVEHSESSGESGGTGWKPLPEGELQWPTECVYHSVQLGKLFGMVMDPERFGQPANYPNHTACSVDVNDDAAEEYGLRISTEFYGDRDPDGESAWTGMLAGRSQQGDALTVSPDGQVVYRVSDNNGGETIRVDMYYWRSGIMVQTQVSQMHDSDDPAGTRRVFTEDQLVGLAFQMMYTGMQSSAINTGL